MLVAFIIPEQITYISVYLMFSVIGIWNSYFWPLVMTNSDKFRPLLIIYCFGSKQIIKAFTYNGIK